MKLQTLKLKDENGKALIVGVSLLQDSTIQSTTENGAKSVIHTPVGKFYSLQSPGTIHRRMTEEDEYNDGEPRLNLNAS